MDHYKHKAVKMGKDLSYESKNKWKKNNNHKKGK